ncbi:probable xyloglucan endotransglucosylase/hydrolase protein 30 [Magnolia sinica]|uniref:probable xyloglucan endotransglucosylase/hydrolase protein 30 n=1 Tax=Magnolia sinica TaxID=86752 RepID=UPI00265AFCD8|nr:probable xyloglucan endotransglucosylase/hydrolase protein 30 [Magnolia sinica]
MALSSTLTFLSFLLSLSCVATLTLSFNVSTLSFDEAYSPLFGDGNLVRSPDGKSVRLLLDRYTGSGFISSDPYQHGLFSASIKLPSEYTAGVVVAFYTSNGDIFEKTHDELDFEFLGNIQGKPWRVQTNLYGNGSVSRGREERYVLWFDPTKEFHRYSILWTQKNVIFYIDEVPIREVIRSDEMGGDYPSKPMSLYATIWDGSTWATSGGRYKVNYKYAPFVSEFTDLVLHGCAIDPIQQLPTPKCSGPNADLSDADYAEVTPERRVAMQQFREKYMIYSYCYDILRYPVPPPECVIVPAEKKLFKDSGHLKFAYHRHRRHHRSKRSQSRRGSVRQERTADM